MPLLEKSPVLREMLESRSALDPSGTRHDVHSAIHTHCAEALYQTVLARRPRVVDFAYIDGNHTFDYVLVDFWFLDKLLRVGGLVGFNDCDWPAVHKAIKFVLTHRRYVEADVGLASRYVDYSAGRELLRRVKGVPRGLYYRNANDRYFVKQESWEPRWDFFAPF